MRKRIVTNLVISIFLSLVVFRGMLFFFGLLNTVFILTVEKFILVDFGILESVLIGLIPVWSMFLERVVSKNPGRSIFVLNLILFASVLVSMILAGILVVLLDSDEKFVIAGTILVHDPIPYFWALVIVVGLAMPFILKRYLKRVAGMKNQKFAQNTNIIDSDDDH